MRFGRLLLAILLSASGVDAVEYPFISHPHDFDGATYFTEGGWSGAADSGEILVAGAFRVDGGAGTVRTIQSSSANRIRVRLIASNALEIRFVNGAGTELALLTSTSTFAAGSWHTFAASGNTAVASSFQLLVDGALEVSGVSAASATAIDFTQGTWSFGADAAGANFWNGCLGPFAVWGGAGTRLDLSNATNVDKLFDDSNKPVDWGRASNGATVNGVVARVYTEGGNPTINYGTGGSYELIAGTRTACSDSSTGPITAPLLTTTLKASSPAASRYMIVGGSRALFGVGMKMNGENAAEFVFAEDADGFWRISTIRGGVSSGIALDYAASTEFGTAVYEFAIHATESGSGIAADWIPQHGAADGAIVVTDQDLFVDGGATTLGALGSSAFAVDEVRVEQDYTAYSANDTSKVNPLWDGTIVHTFDENGLTVAHTLTTVTTVAVDNGYAANLESKIAETEVLLADNGYTTTLATPGTQENHSPGRATSALFYSESSGFAAAAAVSDIDETTEALAYVDDFDPTLMTERTDGYSKWYWRVADSNAVIPSATTLSGTTNYYIAAGASDPLADPQTRRRIIVDS